MEVWRQKQQQVANDQQQQQQQVVRSKAIPKSDSQVRKTQAPQQQKPKQQQVELSIDPLQSIANVLNHHHNNSKLILANKKKSQQREAEESSQAATGKPQKNKLDQQKSKAKSSSLAGHLDLQVGSKNNTNAKLPLLSTSSTSSSSSSAVAAATAACELQKSKRQDKSLAVSCSHHISSAGQVDQGNSYLYAYNDFVSTPTTSARLQAAAGASRQHQQQSVAATSRQVLAPVEVLAATSVADNNSCGQLLGASREFSGDQQQQQKQPETLIDSDEDDNLSYILHQHRTHRQSHCRMQQPQANQRHLSSGGANYRLASDEEHLAEYLEADEREAQFRIHDHHLSCSRSSHPRHICGISGGASSSIAARLREESQRAFLLNQNQNPNQNQNQNSTNHQRNNHRLAELLANYHGNEHLNSHDTRRYQEGEDADDDDDAEDDEEDAAHRSRANETAAENQLNFTHELEHHQQQLAAYEFAASIAAAATRDSALDAAKLINHQHHNNLQHNINQSKGIFDVAGCNLQHQVGDSTTSGFVVASKHRALDSSNEILAAPIDCSIGSTSDGQTSYGHPTSGLLAAPPQKSIEFLRRQQQLDYQQLKHRKRKLRRPKASNRHQESNSPTQNGAQSLFGWLFCCLCNLFSASKQQAHSSQLLFPHTQQATSVHKSVASSSQQPQQQNHHLDTKSSWRPLANESSASLSMYSTSSQSQQQQLASIGQLSGQVGAYYATNHETQAAAGAQQVPPAGYNHHHPHLSHSNHHHSHHHHHSYPHISTTSDHSSMSSSLFASSALRMNHFFKTYCCSKRCLLFSCLAFIILIFIFVISLSAYLNFLINLNKLNLVPLSGRFKIETQGDTFNSQLLNRTSREFLAKQLEYETILRGAFDRTQTQLKSYPNHLVKCEVYTFKQGSLWVYFRLFLNKKTLMLDGPLMRRKSPDEHLDKQFLPRLTQQTLQSGFEQLLAASGFRSLAANASSSLVDHQEPRRSRATQEQAQRHHKDHVMSFDEQISRLMPIIQSIDMQSIQVTPEFDMLATSGGQQTTQQSMSDNLRASQFITPTTPSTIISTTFASSPVLMATAPRAKSTGAAAADLADGESLANSSSSTTFASVTLRPATAATSGEQSGDEISVSTKKFTLFGYKENSTRPTTTTSTSTQPTTVTQATMRQQQDASPFLVSHQRKPNRAKQQVDGNSGRASQGSNTLRELSAARPATSAEAEDLLKREKLVKLVSGQPVVSQNINLLSRQNQNLATLNLNEKLSGNNKTTSKQDHSSAATTSGQSQSDNSNKLSSGFRQPVNETIVMQMIAPYQVNPNPPKPQQQQQPQSQQVAAGGANARRPLPSASTSSPPAGGGSGAQTLDPATASIQDLWDNALNSGQRHSGNTNSTDQRNRLISVTTIGGGGLNSSATALDGPQMTPQPTAISSSTSTSQPPTTSSQKPKVSPHLRHGGSLISTSSSSSSSGQQQASAVLLNRDFNQHEGQQQPTTRSQAAQTAANKLERQRKPQRNSTSGAGDLQKQRLTNSQRLSATSSNKLQKLKKVAADPAAIRNNTSVSTGIRIVDNLLASIESRNVTRSSVSGRPNPSLDQSLPTTIELSRSSATSSTTLPPPQSSGASRTLSSRQNEEKLAAVTATDQSGGPSMVEYTTTSSSHEIVTPQDADSAAGNVRLAGAAGNSSTIAAGAAVKPQTATSGHQHSATGTRPQQSSPFTQLVGDQQQPRVGTSNFSNQWRPIGANHSATTQTSGSNSRKPPNLSLIIGTERLPPTLTAPSNQGSQSPFAMSTAIFDSSGNVDGQRTPTSGRQSSAGSTSASTRKLNRISGNSYTSNNNNNNHHHNNDFESHRMSRMGLAEESSPTRLQQQPPSTTTSSSLEANTRVVDDFMITTDRSEGNTRGSTLLPPLVVSGLAQQPLARADGSRAPLVQQPKRTRGPFAFETLKSFAPREPATSGVESSTGEDLAEPSERLSSTSRSERSPRLQSSSGSSSNNNDDKLLVRKKLFVDDSVESSLVAGEDPNGDRFFDRFGHRTSSGPQVAATAVAADSSTGVSRVANLRGKLIMNNLFSVNHSVRCQYYGCMAKDSTNYTCLSRQQICDDFIDCQDESDELDCVSLLKHDSKRRRGDEASDESYHPNDRLSFSNGAGIIYLNRKGSLAPMCIDYFGGSSSSSSSSGSSRNPEQQPPAGFTGSDSVDDEVAQRQQELIRQINTIGQYACSLQSFSRLVSVKINHHDLVDDTNLIRNSKLFHRLSIVARRPLADDSNNAGSSYRSGHSDHEVEITTSSECPSQRTVFVKCGGFDCGQDSFSIIEQSNKTPKRRNGVVINDFPWLVKLYWEGVLSCHGYLIDESWLISSSDCFMNRTRDAGWTAEISYEHYGNEDYQSIESNRRSVESILFQPTTATGDDDATDETGQSRDSSRSSSIVLAKLEKPVRFSPLNRPICLPPAATGANKTQELESIDKNYKDCVTATMQIGSTSSVAAAAAAPDLVLGKAKLLRLDKCLESSERPKLEVKRIDDLICVDEIANKDDDNSNGDPRNAPQHDATRVLICSTNSSARTRSKWTVVGVQSKASGLRTGVGSSARKSNRQLFTTVASQIEWIVDTMTTLASELNGGYPRGAADGLNPLSGPINSSPNTCNMFRCSSGECLSWSRICDGLYDCSSHDDERDCHR